MTGYVLEKIFLEHKTGFNHPESPERLKTIQSLLKDYPKNNLKRILARKATKDEICYIHSLAYYEEIKATQLNKFLALDLDTATSQKSFEAAITAVGGVLNLIDAVFQKEVENAFAFVRPPGHHAEKDKAMGFCLFNNIAIGAAYALARYELAKIAIIDVDLHHGNGTQKAFYETDKVLYISTHQHPYYPGTGNFDEIGKGAGEGYTINFPLSIGGDDSFYNKLFEQAIIPIVDQYQPELILVSCGFDTFIEDPLGQMSLTAKGYGSIARQILDLAKIICDGRVIYSLEGGYDLNGIKTGTKAILDEMTGLGKDKYSWKEDYDFLRYMEEVRDRYSSYWKL